MDNAGLSSMVSPAKNTGTQDNHKSQPFAPSINASGFGGRSQLLKLATNPRFLSPRERGSSGSSGATEVEKRDQALIYSDLSSFKSDAPETLSANYGIHCFFSDRFVQRVIERPCAYNFLAVASITASVPNKPPKTLLSERCCRGVRSNRTIRAASPV